MKLSDVYAKLIEFNQPILQTQDVGALLKISTLHASQMLRRLTNSGLIYSLKRGLWVIQKDIDVLMIPEYLTAPSFSYISLQSALYYHGLISQIPNIIYAVTLARTQKFKTSFGTFSLHHVDPGFFFGYTVIGKNNIKLASPEKALIDIFYLSATRSYQFKSLPEIEIPNSFNKKEAFKMVEKISNQRIKHRVLNKLQLILSH